MSSGPSVKPKRGRQYCCVVGCSHHYGGESECSFFKVKQKTEEKNLLWRQRISRENPDKSLWSPSEYSRICGCHFVQKRPSLEERDPDFAPSIFPTSHVKEQKMSDVHRYNRVS